MCKVEFHDLGVDTVRPNEAGLIMAIRTDARHATRELKRNLAKHLELHEKPRARFESAVLDGQIEKVLHGAYKEWGHGVLSALSENVDYSKYGITNPDEQKLQVHFYNSQDLGARAIRKALEMGYRANPLVDPMLISLDDLIHDNVIPIYEIAFSRLFSVDGKQQYDYVPRPGHEPLSYQFEKIREEAARRHLETGVKAPIVFIEDNVRYAKMLNWLTDEMKKYDIFEHAEMAGISTCFCCATDQERNNIVFDGKTVPVEAIVDYGSTVVEVSTPRDLMFDGFVVEMGETTMRLPGIFMDVESRFKIHPETADQFCKEISQHNVTFCETLKDAFGVDVPLSWFAVVADPVAHITDVSPMTPMAHVMRNVGDRFIPAPPAPKLRVAN